MSLLQRLLGRPPDSAAAAPAEVVAEPIVELHRSPSIEAIVHAAKRHQGRLQVLDLGPARPSTFAFLEPFSPRLCVADLERRRLEPGPLEDALPTDGGWNVVLGWGLLDLLDRDSSQRLARRLDALLDPGALIHVVVSREREIDAEPPELEFAEDGRLVVRRLGSGRRAGPGWTQRELARWLRDCEVEANSLHQTGFLETLLRRR